MNQRTTKDKKGVTRMQRRKCYHFVATNFEKTPIEGKEMSITLQESLNQDDRFSKNHVRFDGMLEVFHKSNPNPKRMYFSYQFNPEYFKPTFTDVLDCLLLDASSFENSRTVGEFCREYGYEDIDKGISAYEACKKTSQDLRNILSSSELDALYELSDNEWDDLEEDMEK